MAILPAVPSLAVELLQNCTAMMELNASAEDVANSSNNSIIKYVMAESGENFEIHWCIDRSNDSLFCGDTPTFTDHDLFTRVHIDGVYIDGLIWSKEELQLSEKFHDRLLRASSLNEDGQRVENRFSFSDIARSKHPETCTRMRLTKTAEEDLAVLSESVKEKLNSLGVIKVELWRIQGIQGVQDGVAVRSSTAEEVTSVPQRAVKTSSASHTVK